MGKTLVNNQFSSADIVKTMLMGGLPKVPNVDIPIVDVENVAQAHLNALKMPDTDNQRFILCDKTLKFLEVGQCLAKDFAPPYSPPSSEIPACLAKFLGLFNS
mmetsp:Transcript_1903/g.3302  ORF Transcript_1903/g.3302 Transcript_1903/m.3302 type:complete len:103 (+) Transcript_1903:728-1036(+)